jgi:hypothetical protein
LGCEYFHEFSKKILNGPNGILRGLGKLIHEKTLKSKNSWHCPFNMYSMFITEYDEIGRKERNADDSQTYGFLTFMGFSQSKEKKYIEYSAKWPA